MNQLPPLFSFFSPISEEIIDIYNNALVLLEKEQAAAKTMAQSTLLLFSEGKSKDFLQLPVFTDKNTDPQGTVLEIFWLQVIQKSLNPGIYCSMTLNVSEQKLHTIDVVSDQDMHDVCSEIEKTTNCFIQCQFHYLTKNEQNCKNFRFACELTMDLPRQKAVIV
jgi:hypothetical protein